MARILHIEDNAENLLLVRRLLEAGGHTVLEAPDAYLGMKAASRERPDLVLMDINLPGLDGSEATTIIKGTPGMATIPVVAITSNVFPGARERCLVAGCDGYIPKPIEVDSFVETIEAYLDGHRDDLPLEKRAAYLSEYSRDLAASLEEQAYARHFLEGIIMQSPVSTLITDKNGVCVMHNHVYAEVFGLQGSAVGRYHIFEDRQLTGGDDIDAIRRVFAGVGQEQFQAAYEIPDKGERILRFSFFPVRDSGDRVKNVVVQHLDITDEVRALEEQKHLRKQLFQAQKMESIGTLAGGVAHDFNNLLVGVLGGSELLIKNLDPRDSRYKLLTIIRDSALKMSDLTRSLLAYAQGGKFVVERVETADFIRNTVDFARRVIDRQIEIDERLSPDVPPLVADRGQLHQVLMNIIMNAADAITGRGRIAVETSLDDPPATAGLDDGIGDPHVLIRISDTGSGMTDEVLGRLFEPFFSTRGTGRGLGMAAVYGIARQHKATVQAMSTPGTGTVVTLRWPAARGPCERVAEAETPAETPRDTARIHGAILIVDDEAIVREVATDILEGFGFTVFSAEDGDVAIDTVREKPDIDLVLLDIIMKRMNGRETFEALKEMRPDLKILVSSGFDQKGPVSELIDLGADGFIQKPYNMDDLLEKVRSLIGADA